MCGKHCVANVAVRLPPPAPSPPTLSPARCPQLSPQPLTQSDFNAATWEVVNSPSTSVTKWGPIEDWDTSGVTTLKYAFSTSRNEAGNYVPRGSCMTPDRYCNPSAATFNGDISKWITSSVTDMGWTFNGAAKFNGDISKWITTSVKSLRSTFNNAAAFNSDISTWITSPVTDMRYTFYGASSFTGTGLDLWNINKVKNMDNTFNGANALTSCSKRKIADAWKSNVAFTATYYTDWAADTCPVRC